MRYRVPTNRWRSRRVRMTLPSRLAVCGLAVVLGGGSSGGSPAATDRELVPVTTVCNNLGGTTDRLLDTADGAVSSPVDITGIEQNLRDGADDTLAGITGPNADEIIGTVEEQVQNLVPDAGGTIGTVADQIQRLRDDARQIQVELRDAALPGLIVGQPDDIVLATVSFLERLTRPAVLAALEKLPDVGPQKSYAGYPAQYSYFLTTIEFDDLADLTPAGDMAALYSATIREQIKQYAAIPADKMPPGLAVLLADHRQESSALATGDIPLIGVTVQTTREHARQLADEHAEWVVSVTDPACDPPQVIVPDESVDPYVRRLEHPLPDANVNTGLFEAPTPDGAPPPIINPLDYPLEPVPGPDDTWVTSSGDPQ